MIFDLTMPIDERTPNYPGDPKIKIKQYSVVEKGGIAKKLLTFHSHFSTHIDAPSHMVQDAKTLSDFAVNTFIGEVIVLDVRGKNEIETDLSEVKEGYIVFFLTGHSKKAYDKNYFTNNPVITEKTAQDLINKKIRIVGLDSFTPDNEPYAVHKMFFKENILIVENLVNLEKLAGKKFQCYILPLKIKDADGAPCRVIAISD